MADIKTELRELSVLYGISQLKINKTINEKPEYDKFNNSLSEYLSEEQLLGLQLNDKGFIENNKIFSNGILLAKALYTQLNLDAKTGVLEWVGDQPHMELPIDVMLFGVPVSLKEESFILENMGLYKLVSLLTHENYRRGSLHIFKDFAPNLFENWFSVTWGLLLEYLETEGSWNYKNDKYTSGITSQGSTIFFSYNRDTKNYNAELPSKLNIEGYEELTNATLREKVFSKWINSEISRNPIYTNIKKECSVKAGTVLVNILKSKLTLGNLARLLQVFSASYYYAKCFNLNPEIYYVPSLEEFTQDFEIQDISCEVPVSQLNIYTKILNKQTGNTLLLRNEIRYSHGQFNGIPEAKLYYSNGSSLDTIYKKLYPTT